MRKLFVAAALAPACFILTAAAAPIMVQDVLDQLQEKTDEFFKDKGFEKTGWINNGSLAAGATKTVNLQLKGGSGYGVVGICDKDCGDLNLNLYDSSGKEVDNDVKDDDLPIVVAAETGNYTLKVSMVKCKSSSCRYRLISYGK